MNLDSLSCTLSQIDFLVDHLSEKNYQDSCDEIANFVKQGGLEVERYLLRYLISRTDFSTDEPAEPNSTKFYQRQLLKKAFNSLLNNPSFITILCFAFDKPADHEHSSSGGWPNLEEISRAVELSPVQNVVLALALQHSENDRLVAGANKHIRKHLADLINDYVNAESGASSKAASKDGLHDASPETLHLILTHVFHDANNVELHSETRDRFLKCLRRDFPRELVPIVLAPFLYPADDQEDSQQPSDLNMDVNVLDGSNVIDLIREFGYGFTANVAKCREVLENIGCRNLTAQSVAEIISYMARTCSGLEDTGELHSFSANDQQIQSDPPTTWNIQVFIEIVLELNPSIDWKKVIENFDHPDFFIKNRQSLALFTNGLCYAMKLQSQSPEQLPVELFISRHWKYLQGQFSLIQQTIMYPDVFSFANYPCRLVNVDVLKIAPTASPKMLQIWRSLDIVELLLYMAENNLEEPVNELFAWPTQHCPDVLTITLLKIDTAFALRRQLLITLIQIFLDEHPNSTVILQNAWNMNDFKIRSIIIDSMADWYLRSDHDQMRLSRILDVAQEFKVLANILNEQSFPFTIDLACLAARRQYLKLEKWLTDKVRDHGELFVVACIKFLHHRCPQILNPALRHDITKVYRIPQETVTTILHCLQVCIGNVSQECADSIVKMLQNCSFMLSNHGAMIKTPQPVMNVLRPTNIDIFNTALNRQQVLSTNQIVDPLAGVESDLASVHLNSSLDLSFSSAFTRPVDSAVQPESPAALIGQSFTPIPAGPQTLQQLMQPVGSQSSTVTLQDCSTPNKIDLSQLVSAGPVKNVQPTLKPLNLFPDNVGTFNKEIEDEANSYFQRIYNLPPHPTLSIDEVLDILKKFRDSNVRREREVFSCMLRNLFDEYQFFPQYPERELLINAQLFGGIIQRNVVHNLLPALQCVFDALSKPESDNMFRFGVVALDRCKSRLKENAVFCEHLRSIQHFHKFPPHLIEYVECGLRGQEPTPIYPQNQAIMSKTLPSEQAPIVMPYKSAVTTAAFTATTTSQVKSSTITKTPSIANATNINTLLVATDREEKMIIPPEYLLDKTAFIFNNLSQMNLKQKCEEIKNIMSDEYWPWVAQYLVMKRVSIELNFHSLYSNFLDCLNRPDLNKMVTRETFRNIKVLLRSDKGIANFSDRSLLKNLGHWLGMLTLGRNKPILLIDIDLKSLLAEAYCKGLQELLYVVPFVAKVLESCANSRVFRPPNPWTMSIMNVLAELHSVPDLKLNLKFEIEVLRKCLSINDSQVKPGEYLKESKNRTNIKYQLSCKKPQASENNVISQQLVQPEQSRPNQVLSSSEPVLIISQQRLQQQQQQQQKQQPQQPQPQPQPQLQPKPLQPHQQIIAPANPAPVVATKTATKNFSYIGLSVTNVESILPHIVVNPKLPLFLMLPELKQVVHRKVVEAIRKWVHTIIEHAIPDAIATTETIVKKDFALDYDENNMRTAARYMVRTLTAGVTMIACHDKIMPPLITSLKNTFLAAVDGTVPRQKEMAEQAANVAAYENVDLICAFTQKAAIEKAIPELEKRLQNEFEVRKIARLEGRCYVDLVAKHLIERLPEPIRPKVGGVTPQQMAVYEEFVQNIPDFLPLSEREVQALFEPKAIVKPPAALQAFGANAPGAVTIPATQQAVFTTVNDDELGLMLRKLSSEVEILMKAINPTNAAMSQRRMALHNLIDALIVTHRSRDALDLLKQAMLNLLDEVILPSDGVNSEFTFLYRDLHVKILRCLQDPRAYGMQWVNNNLTRLIIDGKDEHKYSFEAIDCLIKSHLLNLSQFDLALAQAMETCSVIAVHFAIQLVHMYLIEGRQTTHVREGDLRHTIETLVKMTLIKPAPESLPLYRINTLIKALKHTHDSAILKDRLSTSPTAHIHSGILQVRSRNCDDPAGLQEQTEFLLREWVSAYHDPSNARDLTKAFSDLVHQMNNQGILKTDELITRFLKLSTQMCVDHCYRVLTDKEIAPSISRAKCYHTLDPFVRLIAMLVKHSGDQTNTHTKANLLNKVLGIVTGVLFEDHEIRGTAFQQLPYHRIFIMLFLELCAPEPVFEALNFQVLTAFCHTLHILRSAKAPGFCFAWLELISHRVFIGRMLAITPQQRCWNFYAQLLIDLIKYLAPYLRNAELAKPVAILYKGTLRVLLVLLHDFPEFLCNYYYGLCNVIPPNCIQMRNIILSAFPRNMRLPDPFTPNLKVDMLPEITQTPRILNDFASLIVPEQFKKELDSYLQIRSPVTFLSELRINLQVSPEPQMHYNIELMNALVLYVGTEAIAFIRSKGHRPNMSTIAHSAHMDVFQNLAVDLDTEGRYLFLNAIANQLRYPNSHTHYFSCTLLYLFSEANTEAIQEQITRVLLERLIVNRPHPWGLLITFIELIKNPSYKFWDHEFVRCAPELEKLLESVARSCMVPKQGQPIRELQITE